ncbi:MAG: hypothetical protein ACLQE9_15120, partial [Roseiarcus sp.]
ALKLIERAQNLFVLFHAQRAQENRAQELAFAINTHVQDIFGVVLEFQIFGAGPEAGWGWPAAASPPGGLGR